MQDKDPNTAFILELVGGFFGLLGLGHFYVGRTEDGLIRLIGWLVYVAAAWVGIVVLSIAVVGLLCIPCQAAVQIAVPIWSALDLKKKLEEAAPPGVAAPAGQLPDKAPAATSEGEDEG